MRTTVVIISLFIVAYIVRELWTIRPDSTLISPFYLSDQVITMSTYKWMACIHVVWALMVFCAWYLSRALNLPGLSLWLKWAFIIQALELVEYRVIYNEPWTHIRAIPVNITTLRFLVLSFLTIYIFARWSSLRSQ